MLDFEKKINNIMNVANDATKYKIALKTMTFSEIF